MNHPYMCLLLVMLVAGLLGGWLNYLLGQKEDPEHAAMWQSFLGGLVASFMVPLFLNMISSNLLDGIKGTGSNPGDPSKLLVFAGFCLVAAVSSKAFISTLSDRILKEAKATRQEVRQMKKEVDPIIAEKTEQEPQEMVPLSVSVPDEMSLGENAKKVVAALARGRFTLRTRTGISKDTGLDKGEVSKILDDLVALGLAHKVKVMIRGELKTRWYISAEGRALPIAQQ